MKDTINMATIWTMLVGTVSAVVYMFSNFASAADVERIEVRLLKADIREIRELLKDDPDDKRLEEDLEMTLDELCYIKPDDRECKA